MLVICLMISLVGMTVQARSEIPEAEKTDQGYYLTEQEMIELAEQIKEMQKKISILETENKTLKDRLSSERKAYEKAIEQANKTIKLQEKQIASLEEVNKILEKQVGPDIIEKLTLILAGVGTGQLF